MAYTPNPTWVDGTTGGTPITAATLHRRRRRGRRRGLRWARWQAGPRGAYYGRDGGIGLVTSSSNNAHKVWDMHAATTRPPLRYPSSYRRVSGVWRPA